MAIKILAISPTVDKDALEIIHTKYKQGVTSVCFQITRDKKSAQKLTQDVMSAYLQNREKITTEEELRSFFVRAILKLWNKDGLVP